MDPHRDHVALARDCCESFDNFARAYHANPRDPSIAGALPPIRQQLHVLLLQAVELRSAHAAGGAGREDPEVGRPAQDWAAALLARPAVWNTLGPIEQADLPNQMARLFGLQWARLHGLCVAVNSVSPHALEGTGPFDEEEPRGEALGSEARLNFEYAPIGLQHTPPASWDPRSLTYANAEELDRMLAAVNWCMYRLLPQDSHVAALLEEKAEKIPSTRGLYEQLLERHAQGAGVL